MTKEQISERLIAIGARIETEQDEARLTHLDKAAFLLELISVGAKHVTQDHYGPVSNCLGCAMTDILKELNALDEARNWADAGQREPPQDAQAALAKFRQRVGQ